MATNPEGRHAKKRWRTLGYYTAFNVVTRDPGDYVGKHRK
jgi:hypothetical protein